MLCPVRTSLTASMHGTWNVNTAWTLWESTVVQINCLLHSNTHTHASEPKQTLDDSSLPSTTSRENLAVQTSTSHSMPWWLAGLSKVSKLLQKLVRREQRHDMQRQTDVLNNESHGSHVWWKKRSSCPKSLVARKTSQISKETASRSALTWQKQSFLPQFFADQCSNTYDETVGCSFSTSAWSPNFWVHFNLRNDRSCQTSEASDFQGYRLQPNYQSFPAQHCCSHCSLLNLLTQSVHQSIWVSNQMEASEDHPNLQTERTTQQPR